MFKPEKIKPPLMAALLLSASLPLFAQNPAAQAPQLYSADMVKAYFFLIVVATIINRITQYLKLFLRWLLPKSGWVQSVSAWYWRKMKKRLQESGLSVDEESVRPLLRKFLISVITYTVGIALGIFICVQFDLRIFKDLGLAVPGKTLDAVLSGIAAGLGVEPVHSLFRLAEEKRRLKKLFAEVTADNS